MVILSISMIALVIMAAALAARIRGVEGKYISLPQREDRGGKTR